MCGACGTGTIRPPWEVILAGDRPADRRRRANAAGQAAGQRVKVSPWGAAGYLLAPRTGPIRSFPGLDSLAAGLLPHLRLRMPMCNPCRHREGEHLTSLLADTDRQRLAVWSALATAHRRAGRLTIEIHSPFHRPVGNSRTPQLPSDDRHPVQIFPTRAARPSVLLRGPHAEEYAASLLDYLDGTPSQATPQGSATPRPSAGSGVATACPPSP
jgi:hypothetical protein